MESENPPLMIRPNKIKEITGLSTTTIWRLEKEGKFPKKRQIAPGCVGWLYSEIEEYLQGCGSVI